MNANLAAEILAAEKRWKRIRAGEERSDIYPLPADWESHHEGPPDPARMQWLYADAILLADAYCRTTPPAPDSPPHRDEGQRDDGTFEITCEPPG